VPKKRLTRAEQQALTRREVLDAAARVFPARGYHQTRVEEVADDAGLSIGAVYSNFENKADLFLALYGQHVERWVAELEQRVLEGETPAARTTAAARWWADFMKSERAWMVLEIEFWAHAVRDEELRDRFAALFAPLRDKTAELIERGAREFGITLPAPAHQLALGVTALCTGLMVERALVPESVEDDAFGPLLEAMLRSFGLGGNEQA
jgi:AcrR family transcriptional regulator